MRRRFLRLFILLSFYNCFVNDCQEELRLQITIDFQPTLIGYYSGTPTNRRSGIIIGCRSLLKDRFIRDR